MAKHGKTKEIHTIKPKLNEMVTAALQARKYEQEIKENPWKCLEPLKKAARQIKIQCRP